MEKRGERGWVRYQLIHHMVFTKTKIKPYIIYDTISCPNIRALSFNNRILVKPSGVHFLKIKEIGAVLKDPKKLGKWQILLKR